MILYNNWQESTVKYNLIESLIENMFLKQLEILDLEREKWVIPYFNTTFANGKNFMDGDPIFSVLYNNNKKIIKVIIDDEWDEFTITSSNFDNNLLLTITINTEEIEILSTVFRTILLVEFKDILNE